MDGRVIEYGVAIVGDGVLVPETQVQQWLSN